MDTHQKKEELRDQLLDKRKNIPFDDFERNSEQIFNNLEAQPEFQQAGTIHCYVSINEKREVNTHVIIKKALAKERDVVVPVTNFDDGTLTHLRLSSFDALKSNKWGVLEPQSGEQVSADEIELVIVPMVAGDENCNRIGYGKGFYDRFLENVACPKIGLLFEQNVIAQIPVEDFDVPLDKIITEQRVIER